MSATREQDRRDAYACGYADGKAEARRAAIAECVAALALVPTSSNMAAHVRSPWSNGVMAAIEELKGRLGP